MCRYAERHYKPHFACFACRKAFKRRLKRDVDPSGPDRPARCPECRGPVAELGLDFKPPVRRDAKAWALVADLFTVGETFFSCGCQGPGYRPRSRPEYRAFLRERRAAYEQNLRAWEREPDGDAKTAAVSTWRARLAAIDAARLH